MLYDLFDTLSVNNVDRGHDNKKIFSKSELVDAAIQIMSKELSTELSIINIAARLQVSRSHLFSVFKEHVGCSPKSHLKLMRLEMSLEYLRNPDYRIAEVAHSVGYSDPLFYSREFKKWLGVCSKVYREKMQ